jgi:N-acetyl-anhydromuramyl-L-alanine amidase AmpD
MSEPPITRRAAHGSRPQSGTPIRVVIHDEEYRTGPDSAEAIASYFASQGAGGSAHYCVDSNSEQHCVPDGVQAWHAPPNDRSIGIEQDGYSHYTAAEWDTAGARGTIARCAARTAELCRRYKIPIRWIYPADLHAGAHGLTDHDNVSQAWHQSDHNDPGRSFPRGKFLELVQSGYNTLGDVRGFQRTHGLLPDGDAGVKTIHVLGDSLIQSWSGRRPPPPPPPLAGGNRFAQEPTIQDGSSGTPVRDFQNAINVVQPGRLAVDGEFGAASARACRDFQAFWKISGGADGICGPATWAALDGVLDMKGK